MTTLFDTAGVQARIFTLPNRPPFMIATDLAEVYGTTVSRLNEAVSRNPERFPEDFMFTLTEAELEALRSQNATANRGDLKSQNVISTKARYSPKVFTHAGAYALSAVLKTPTAARVSVIVHRAFAAMEKAALDDAKAMINRLTTEQLLKTPLRVRVRLGVEMGLTFDAICKQCSAPKWKVAEKARECFAIGLIDRLPVGIPALQPNLFGEV
jgi:hypothetical protein